MVVYLDCNATTPVAKEVQETICSSLSDSWANPSSSYQLGKESKYVVEESRRMVADMIGSIPNEVIFTSGGTESNNMVLHSVVGTFRESKSVKPHIITSNIEHDSLKLPLEHLSARKIADVSFIPVSKVTGSISVDDIINEIRPTTCLISIMLANNETGVIQPVHLLRSKIKSLFKTNGKTDNKIFLHSDAAQAIGKVEVDVKYLDVDFLTIVGHKFYGPRIGALYCKQGVPLRPLLYGGGQEKNIRPGTENTCMIAGLGKAAELVVLHLDDYNKHMLEMKNYLEECLKKTFEPNIVFNLLNSEEKLPNTISVAFNFEKITGYSILAEATDICASTGAACHSGGKPSSVLIASGVSSELAEKTLRLSVGRETTKQDIDRAVEDIKKAIKTLCAAHNILLA